MRKSRIVASLAALAIAGSGAGMALASAPAASAAVTTAAVVQAPHVAPLFQTWHKMTVTYNGTTYNGYYAYLVLHADGLVTGWLYDGNTDVTGVPGYLPLHGDFSRGGILQFNATYAAGNPQGTRGFLAVVSPGSLVSGLWNETGSEAGSGAFAFLN